MRTLWRTEFASVFFEMDDSNTKDSASDWSYYKRRQMQEIIPGLYLGPFLAATKAKVNQLVEVGITHIICVRQELEAQFIHPNFPDKFQYKIIEIADVTTANLISLLPKVKQFIDDCFKTGGKVLVHGNAGISRSAALVIGYIMETRCLPYRDAFELVQNKRFCVCPNEGFQQQLMEYEPIYKAKRTLQNGQTSQVTGHLKRRFDEVEDSECTTNFMDVCEEYTSL